MAVEMQPVVLRLAPHRASPTMFHSPPFQSFAGRRRYCNTSGVWLTSAPPCTMWTPRHGYTCTYTCTHVYVLKYLFDHPLCEFTQSTHPEVLLGYHECKVVFIYSIVILPHSLSINLIFWGLAHRPLCPVWPVVERLNSWLNRTTCLHWECTGISVWPYG